MCTHSRSRWQLSSSPSRTQHTIVRSSPCPLGCRFEAIRDSGGGGAGRCGIANADAAVFRQNFGSLGGRGDDAVAGMLGLEVLMASIFRFNCF